MSGTVMTEGKRYYGQVKWFNNKAGYGFITIKDDHGEIKDIFTHYSTVQTLDSQYKYLVQGEYVEFELTKSTNDKHLYQATNITGIGGGKLMCETRQLNRQSYHLKDLDTLETSVVIPQNDGEFTRVVKKNRKPSRKSTTNG